MGLTAKIRQADGSVVVCDLIPRKTLSLGEVTHRKIVARLSARYRPTPTSPWVDAGVLSTRVVTTVFANLLVDALQGISGATINTFKYHDSGTGVTAEAEGDTALETPCGEARDTGTQTEGATANIYKSVAPHTYTTSGGFTITEHGIFSAASGGTLLDRSVFESAGIPVTPTSEVEWTYQLSVVAGG